MKGRAMIKKLLMISALVLAAQSAVAEKIRGESTAYELEAPTKIAITSASALTTATYISDTALWGIYCDVDCFYSTGLSPTATSGSIPLPGRTMRIVAIDDNKKLAIIVSGSTTGSAWISRARQ